MCHCCHCRFTFDKSLFDSCGHTAELLKCRTTCLFLRLLDLQDLADRCEGWLTPRNSALLHSISSVLIRLKYFLLATFCRIETLKLLYFFHEHISCCYTSLSNFFFFHNFNLRKFRIATSEVSQEDSELLISLQNIDICFYSFGQERGSRQIFGVKALYLFLCFIQNGFFFFLS